MASNRRGISGGRECRGAAPRSMVRRGMVRLRRIQSGCPRQTHHTGDRARAGFNLAAHGKLITPVIAPAPDDPKTLGLGLHTYWVMPLHLLFQAGWYKLFGFSLFALRSVSILWGLVALWSWFWIMRALTGETPIAVLTVALLGT